MASREENGLYEVAPDTYLTKNLAKYLKKKGHDPARFYSEKIEPYMAALSNRKCVFVAPRRDTEGDVIIPIFPEDITYDRGYLVVKETAKYKDWMKKVDDIVTDATSYIM